MVLLALVACSKGEYGPDPRIQEARERGEELFAGRAGCIECHSFGDIGDKVRGPNLGEGGPRTAAYVAASIVDPDAAISEGFVRGVMKAPDEPPVSLSDDDIVALAVYISGGEDVDEARAAIAPARAAREERRRQSALEAEIRRVAFYPGDVARGAQLFQDLGCSRCHGNPANARLKAPDLAKSAERLGKADIVRWLIAPSVTNMPSYGHCTEPQQIADLCEYVISLGATVSPPE